MDGVLGIDLQEDGAEKEPVSCSLDLQGSFSARFLPLSWIRRGGERIRHKCVSGRSAYGKGRKTEWVQKHPLRQNFSSVKVPDMKSDVLILISWANCHNKLLNTAF